MLQGPIARGSIVSVAIRLAGMGVGLVQAILIARILGPEGYGIVASVLASAQILSVAVLLGANEFAIREIPRLISHGKEERLRPLLLGLVVLVIGASALVLVLLISLYLLVGSEFAVEEKVVAIGGIIFPVLALGRIIRAVAQGLGDVALAQWPSDIFRPVLTIGLLLSVAILTRGASAFEFLAIFAMTAFAALVLSLILVWQRLPHDSEGDFFSFFDRRIMGPYLGIALVSVVGAEFATLALALLSTAEQTGMYQPVARLSLLIALPVTAAAMRFAPRVTEFFEQGEMERLANITHQFTLATTGLTVLIGAGIALAAPWLLLLFGPGFSEAAPLLWIVATGFVVNAAIGPVGFLLVMSGHARSSMTARVIGLAIGVVCAIILTPGYGATGAATSSMVALVSGTILIRLQQRKRIDIDATFIGAFNAWRKPKPGS